MSKKSLYFVTIFAFLMCGFVVELGYLSFYHTCVTSEINQKKLFGKYISFPDLALSQTTPYIRNRTLNVEFEKYPFMQQFVDTDLQSFAINIKSR
jgi:hypothetical protein